MYLKLITALSWVGRGVGSSTPPVKVFSNKAEGSTWDIAIAGDPLFNITADAMARTHARFTTYNALAERTRDIAPYVNTAAVAEDMLDIAKAHGTDKLQYWGFS